MTAKRLMLTALTVITAITFGNFGPKAYGAEEPNAPAQKQQRVERKHRARRMVPISERVERRMAELSGQLNLTEEQKKAIGPILEKELKDVQALRTDSTLSKEEKIEKMKGIREAAQADMNKVLTPEQQKKLAEAKEEMQQENRENVGLMVQQRIEAMSERLTLTDEQKQKIQPIVETEIRGMLAARDDETLSQEQRIEKMKAIRQTSREEIDKILTPEQKAKLAEGKASFQPRRSRRRIADANNKN